ncbi:fungal-specific transcription factor domain-containing protein [Delphinella strobiligena]|nr:fungal-specific transcription factor domain-containing protein [Delphinella strobiligena]
MESQHYFQPPRQEQKEPKKLRFITNHGAPHPKRRRVNAACLTCRKRKVACSGEKPECQTCLQNKTDCDGYDAGGHGKKTAKDKPEAAVNAEAALDTSTASMPTQFDAKPPTFQSIVSSNSTSAQERNVTNRPREATFAKETDSTQGKLASVPPDIQEGNRGNASTSSLFSRPRNRMPYFRWLGPTAIMPGFKQMLVKVNHHDNGVPSNPSTDDSPSMLRNSSVLSSAPLPADVPSTLPFYDTSSMPPSELITHLCNTFFTHLGCNFPFLQRDRFLKDIEEKEVDAILVDAVCALAARFSTHQLLTQQNGDGGKTLPSEYGSVFAQHAKEALIHTFATPNVAAVQATLLLAYNDFGEAKDSGLWMYLGIAIRLAQDLGLQKLDGLRYEGRYGPTPIMVKRDQNSHYVEAETKRRQETVPLTSEKDVEEQRAVERERVDTFWVVFFLDRVVSSGTGRRSTLRDKDIELSFPSHDTTDPKTGWPSPFPALIRIIHLYGRVTDLLNGIKESSDITEDVSRKLADMEARVTNFYQGLSIKLHFQAMNFHHHVKAGEGTNFVLLHCWFHTLIVLLHQPTLFKTFGGKMWQLFPDSPHIAMSSAKTIADILSYSQLIDTKASLGNPFTTQPIYIAACAFLKETAEQSASSKEQSRVQSNAVSRAVSRAQSPASDERNVSSSTSNSTIISRGFKTQASASVRNSPPSHGPMPLTVADRLIARHTLLATAASQHYQLCYKALESLETYWAGTKYILTVLDQKFEGVGDPLLYTAEEGESSLERPNPKAEEAFKMPGWRRKVSLGPNHMSNSLSLQGTWLSQTGMARKVREANSGASPATDPNQAIGWTLTGTLNSPSTNLAWHFPSVTNQQPQQQQQMEAVMDPFDFTNTSLRPTSTLFNERASTVHVNSSSAGATVRPQSSHHTPTSLSLHNDSPLLDPTLGFPSSTGSFHLPPATVLPCHLGTVQDDPFGPVTEFLGFEGTTSGGLFGDMLIESQDVDTSLLGLDTMPWFEALPSLADFGIEGFETGDTGAGDEV